MQTITTIGLDIAKSVFQVHGIDAAGQVVIRRQLKRRYVLAFFQKLPPCLVGTKRAPLARAPGNRPQCATDMSAVGGSRYKTRIVIVAV
jgi:transposase